MTYKYLILFIFFTVSAEALAQGLGRLFLTPDQRAQLDLARVKRDQRPLANNDATPITAPPARQGPATVTFNGSVQRSDGKSTVWINGRPVNERNLHGNEADVNVLGVARDGALSITIPQARRTASLKVGQQLDVISGRVEESYARRGTLSQAAETASVASAAPVAAAKGSFRPTRPWRASDFRESDPESGAAAAARQVQK